MTAPDWSLANCLGADPDLFFDEDRESIAAARAVCQRCVIRDGCLEYALVYERFGTWGGMSPRERQQERKRRRAMRRLRSA